MGAKQKRQIARLRQALDQTTRRLWGRVSFWQAQTDLRENALKQCEAKAADSEKLAVARGIEIADLQREVFALRRTNVAIHEDLAAAKRKLFDLERSTHAQG